MPAIRAHIKGLYSGAGDKAVAVSKGSRVLPAVLQTGGSFTELPEVFPSSLSVAGKLTCGEPRKVNLDSPWVSSGRRAATSGNSLNYEVERKLKAEEEHLSGVVARVLSIIWHPRVRAETR